MTNATRNAAPAGEGVIQRAARPTPLAEGDAGFPANKQPLAAPNVCLVSCQQSRVEFQQLLKHRLRFVRRLDHRDELVALA